MQLEIIVSSGETESTEQKNFDASLRIGIIEMSMLVLRYDNSVQTMKIGFAVPIEQQVAGTVSLLLSEIKSSVYLNITP